MIYIGMALLHISRRELMDMRPGEFFDRWAIHRGIYGGGKEEGTEWG